MFTELFSVFGLSFPAGLGIVTVVTIGLILGVQKSPLPDWVTVLLACVLALACFGWLCWLLDFPIFHGWLYEEAYSAIFVFVTLTLGGAGAWMTGRACAQTWRPYYVVVFYLAILACGVRFIHMSLFQGTLLSVHYYLIDFIAMQIIGGLGYRHTRVRQMVSKYAWLFSPAGPFTWQSKT